MYVYSVYSLNPQKRLQLAEELGTTDFPDAQKFLANLKNASDYIAFASLFGKYHSYLPSPRFYYNRYHFRQYTDWFVHRRLKQISSSKAGLEKSSDEHFVFLNELSNVTRDPVQLRDETTSFLIGGHRTTATLLSWTLYYLARLPETYEKLRSIVLSDFGEDLDTSRITVAELRKCKYLQFCLFESLRISSTIPAIAREAARDTTLPGGGGPDGRSPIFVPKGTVVMADLFGLHHRSDIWGQDAEDYRAERWEGQEINWRFCPFGGGPRKCAGRKCCFQSHSFI